MQNASVYSKKKDKTKVAVKARFKMGGPHHFLPGPVNHPTFFLDPFPNFNLVSISYSCVIGSDKTAHFANRVIGIQG